MNTSSLAKSLFAIAKLVTKPQSSLSWIQRGHSLKDAAIIDQTYWFGGMLPRTPFGDIFPEAKEIEISLPRPFDRTVGTSITIEEACVIATLAKQGNVKRVLEIGTFDGNTTLLISTNLDDRGSVVTVDLPPDYDLEKGSANLKYATVLNMTPRQLLGRQLQGQALANRITQIHGDSATLDWNTFGGPFDLIFIDGCHEEPYVRSDSENALRQLAPGGMIAWHDYGVIDDVSRVVDETMNKTTGLKFHAIEGTRLALAI